MKILCELSKKEATGFLTVFLEKIFSQVEGITVEEIKVDLKGGKKADT